MNDHDSTDGLERPIAWLSGAMGLSDGQTPFPWQVELLRRFHSGNLPNSLDIPTGLGKTAVMAIWLVARASGASLPRRLVYVVDRRTVVDQASEAAMQLRTFVDTNPAVKCALRLGEQSLPISTLRGKHIDNREWLSDPTSPAVIVGTVDMVGSKLLFEGYGTSRKMRPYHAGLLGSDVLLVLDEAHLVPPFQHLIESIATGAVAFGERCKGTDATVPPFLVLPLSATGNRTNGDVMELTPPDLEHLEVKQRIAAQKQIELREFTKPDELPIRLAAEAWRLSRTGGKAQRVAVFCHDPAVAEKAQKEILRLAKQAGTKIDAELLIGGRRIFERQQAADWLRHCHFLASSKGRLDQPAFLFATSAGEVGVDLDADQMVSDLVEWERMVQRLGRVNRTGGRDASVIVLYQKMEVSEEIGAGEAKRSSAEKRARERTKRIAELLAPIQLLRKDERGFDGSPSSIRELRARAENEVETRMKIEAATTPEPLRPALTRALVDAWSMTSLVDHTGRPKIGPWLRGWQELEDAQTRVVWRRYLPIRSNGPSPGRKELSLFFEAAPVHLSEVLETERHKVIKWLKDRASHQLKAAERILGGKSPRNEQSEERKRLFGQRVGFVLGTDGACIRELRLDYLNFHALNESERRNRSDELETLLADATLVMDAGFGGCENGRLIVSGDAPVHTGDGPWPGEDAEADPLIGFRVRRVRSIGRSTDDQGGWYTSCAFPTMITEECEESEWLVVEKRKNDAASEDDRSAGKPQLLEMHQSLVEAKVREIAKVLGLSEGHEEVLAVAARLHDEGKRSKRWQRAFRAPSDGDYAKTRGPVNHAALNGYRHEFASLGVALKDQRLLQLPDNLQDLVLHLIAAHHGFARPTIRTDGCDDGPSSALEGRARDVALRFSRVQKHWGPWGLAWLESLLRAADQQVSRNHEVMRTPAAEVVD